MITVTFIILMRPDGMENSDMRLLSDGMAKALQIEKRHLLS